MMAQQKSNPVSFTSFILMEKVEDFSVTKTNIKDRKLVPQPEERTEMTEY